MYVNEAYIRMRLHLHQVRNLYVHTYTKLDNGASWSSCDKEVNSAVTHACIIVAIIGKSERSIYSIPSL